MKLKETLQVTKYIFKTMLKMQEPVYARHLIYLLNDICQ